MISEKLILFCKAPRPGQVKTRMAATLGETRACEIYREMVDLLLKKLHQVNGLQVRFAPDDARSEVARWRRVPDWELAPQGEGDLGQRIIGAFQESFSRGAQRVVVVGSDAPEVEEADIREAFDALTRADMVIGPALDGGYWLIGLSDMQADLFKDLEWSTPTVLEETLAKARALGLSVHCLRFLSDIDTAEDWAAFESRRR